MLIKKGNDYVPIDPEEDFQLSTLDFIIRGGNAFDVSVLSTYKYLKIKLF